MQRSLFILSFFLFALNSSAQVLDLRSITPDTYDFENVNVKKLAEDEHHSTYVIWVRKEVKPHYHAHHTEHIQVISGKGIMKLNDMTIKLKKGTTVLIPQGSVHSVITTSSKPLKVISIQAPKFDGDRIWIE